MNNCVHCILAVEKSTITIAVVGVIILVLLDHAALLFWRVLYVLLGVSAAPHVQHVHCCVIVRKIYTLNVNAMHGEFLTTTPQGNSRHYCISSCLYRNQEGCVSLGHSCRCYISNQFAWDHVPVVYLYV